MNKTFRKAFGCAALLFMLPSCASKCTYQEFVDSLKKIESTPETEKIKIKGTYKEEKYSFEFSQNGIGDLTIKEVGVVTAVSAYMVVASGLMMAEEKECTYYAGSTYKMEYKDYVFELDKYGGVSYIQDGDVAKLNISYTYKK